MHKLLTLNDKKGNYPPSFYSANNNSDPSPALEGNINADICIIGGGFTGLSAALSLAEAGKKVIVLEAQRVGFGASGRNGGQIGRGQRINQDVLEAKFGFEKAKALFEIGNAAHDYVLSLCSNHNIDIGYRKGVAHTEFSESAMKHAFAYAKRIEKDYGYEHYQCLNKNEMQKEVASPKYHGGVIDWGAGHGDPLALALGIAKAAKKAGAIIYEDSYVTKLNDKANTANGSVKAEHYVIACNGYLGNLHKETARHVLPINNFIVASEPLEKERAASLIPNGIAVADSKFVVNYFRISKDNRMLFGGGETYGYRFPKDLSSIAYKPMINIFPSLKGVKIDYSWGGTLAVTINRLPYIRRKLNHWIAAGYSGYGVALGTYTGHIIAKAIIGENKSFDIMSSIPHSAFPGGDTLRHPLLIAAMLWFQLRDKLQI